MDFSNWKKQGIHNDKVFIEDGIFNTTEWDKTTPKILFLAKEAYTSEKELNLIDMINDNGPFQNWHRVAQWTYAIEEVYHKKLIPDFHVEELKEKSYELIQKIAFVNIKKSGGLSYSNNENLGDYVESDKQFLQEQIDSYKPDIVICCGTFDPGFYTDIYKKSSDMIVEKTQWVYEHKTDDVNRIVVDFWHFANRCPSSMNFFALCAVMLKYFQEVRK